MTVANLAFIKMVCLINLIGTLQLFKRMSVILNLETDHTPMPSISLSCHFLTGLFLIARPVPGWVLKRRQVRNTPRLLSDSNSHPPLPERQIVDDALGC